MVGARCVLALFFAAWYRYSRRLQRHALFIYLLVRAVYPSLHPPLRKIFAYKAIAGGYPRPSGGWCFPLPRPPSPLVPPGAQRLFFGISIESEYIQEGS